MLRVSFPVSVLLVVVFGWLLLPGLTVAQTGAAEGAASASLGETVLMPASAYFDVDGSRWLLGLSITKYSVGIGLGFLFSYLVFFIFVARPAFKGNNREAVRFLAGNPTVLVVSAFVAIVSGWLYSGFFEWVRDDVWESSLLMQLESVSPVGAPALLLLVLTFVSRRANRWLVLARDAFEGESDALAELLEYTKTSKLAVLLFDGIDGPKQRNAIELASRYNIGLLQRAMWSEARSDLYRGRLTPREKDAGRRLLALDPAPLNARDRFVQLREELLRLDDLITVEDCGDLLARYDRRSSSADRRDSEGQAPGGVERRRNDRRAGCRWQPPVSGVAA